jgi:hypothetical protein
VCGIPVRLKLEWGREEVFPFLELVVEFSDDRWELMGIRCNAGGAGVEEIVYAIKKAAHRYASVSVICTRQRNRGLDVCYSSLWKGGEFSEVVTSKFRRGIK